jgi:site-specific recombinase XerD
MRFSKALVKRKWPGRVSAEWYGRWKPAGATSWKWVKFFTDKRASEGAWEDFKRNQERRAAGVITPAMDLMKRPVPELRQAYLQSLRQNGATTDHLRISTSMLDRLIEDGNWRVYADITAESLREFLDRREKAGDTAEYLRKWVSRAKAFVNAITPAGMTNPLAKVKRPNTAKAKKRRWRRPLTPEGIVALFNAAPDCRKYTYAFAIFHGFRRKEQRSLEEGDLKLNAPIPFIQLREEWTKNAKNDVLPIHRAFVPWFRQQMTGDPNRKIFPTIPDMRTMARDLVGAGLATHTTEPEGAIRIRKGKYIKLADAKGRRLDYHALRHTFKKALENTGTSHTTCKALMRHVDRDVTDQYSSAFLAELAAAINRLRFPTDKQKEWEAQVKTGTGNQNFASYGTPVGHGALTSAHFGAQTKPEPFDRLVAAPRSGGAINSSVCRAFHHFATTLLKLRSDVAKVQNIGPSTQVD